MANYKSAYQRFPAPAGSNLNSYPSGRWVKKYGSNIWKPDYLKSLSPSYQKAYNSDVAKARAEKKRRPSPSRIKLNPSNQKNTSSKRYSRKKRGRGSTRLAGRLAGNSTLG